METIIHGEKGFSLFEKMYRDIKVMNSFQTVFNYLYEDRSIVRSFDNVFYDIVDLVYSNMQTLKPNQGIKLKTNYGYLYKKDSSGHKHISVCDDYNLHISEPYWHQITLVIINTFKKNAAYTYRECVNGVYSDDIIIGFNAYYLKTKEDISSSLQHEITHICPIWANKGDVMSKQTNYVGHIQNEFDLLDDDFEKYKQWLHAYSDYEQQAYINETYRIILDLEPEVINKLKMLPRKYIKTLMISQTHESNRIQLMQTVYNNVLQSDIKNPDVVLLMGFYLTKSKKCNFKSEIIDKEFIKQYLETKSVSINKNEFEQMKKSLLKFIKNSNSKYAKKLDSKIDDALTEIGL